MLSTPRSRHSSSSFIKQISVVPIWRSADGDLKAALERRRRPGPGMLRQRKRITFAAAAASVAERKIALLLLPAPRARKNVPLVILVGH